jgi:hypothetical protein
MKKTPKTKKTKAPKKTNAEPSRKPVAVATVVGRLVEGPIPYLEVIVSEKVSEESMVRLFELVRGQVARYQAKRVLVDMREGSVALTISDMLGLAKLVATTFAGVLERFAILVRPQDLMSEKFFEPSVSSRGLPTFATTDPEEATYWISAKIRSAR